MEVIWTLDLFLQVVDEQEPWPTRGRDVLSSSRYSMILCLSPCWVLSPSGEKKMGPALISWLKFLFPGEENMATRMSVFLLGPNPLGRAAFGQKNNTYALLQKNYTLHSLQKREPHIFPFLQKPTAAQALEGEDVATPITHHQAAVTAPAPRHVGHTYVRAQRVAHGKVCNLKPIQLHSWKHSPPSQTKKSICSKHQ